MKLSEKPLRVKFLWLIFCTEFYAREPIVDDGTTGEPYVYGSANMWHPLLLWVWAYIIWRAGKIAMVAFFSELVETAHRVKWLTRPPCNKYEVGKRVSRVAYLRGDWFE